MSAPSRVVRGYGTLTLTGTGLAGAMVTIGGVAQTISTNTATQVVVPTVSSATPIGAQPIAVTTAGGTSAPLSVDVLAQLQIVSAAAPSATSVVVTFNRDVDATTATAAGFTIAGLSITSASTSANTVTLTTAAQTAGASYTVSCDATVHDAFGAPASSATAMFTGFSPPAPVLVMRNPSDVVAGFSTLTLTGSALASAAVTVGGVTQTVTTNTDTQIVISPVAAATPLGAQPIVATTASGASAPLSVNVLEQLRITAASALSTTSVLVTFNRDVDATTTAAANFAISGLGVTAAITSANTVTLTTAAQTSGATYTVGCMNVLDALGTPVSSVTAMFTGFVPPAPVLAMRTPTDVVPGFSTLTLTGTGLASATVTIGGAAQAVTTNTDTQIVIAPIAAGTPLGAQPIVATTAGGTSSALTVNVIEQLRITAASAVSATSVLVTFNRDVDGTTTAAANFAITGLSITGTSASANTVTLTTSAQTSGTTYTVGCNASVLDALGTPASSATVMFTGFAAPAPVLTGSTPPQVVRGFSSLALTGTGLASATSVTIGGVAQTIALDTDTQIVVSPVDAATPLGSQPIVVTTAGGTTAPLTVDVLPQLQITAASAVSATSVLVTFNRDVIGSTAVASAFTIPGLTISSTSASANTVTLTTSLQTAGSAYTVGCDATVFDAYGTPASSATAMFNGFTPPPPTEFVVVRVGDGSAALSANLAPIFLERRSISTGAVIATVPMPTVASGANFPFTLVGTSIAEGALSRSPDGRSLTMSGYQTGPGVAAPNGIARVVAVIDASDFSTPSGVDTRTTLATVFASTSPRGAVIDGTNIWVGGGAGGLALTTLGATSTPVVISATPSSLRVVNIYDGQLYTSSGSTPTGLYQVGTGTPTTTSTSTLVQGTTGPYAFTFFDLSPSEPGVDTLYFADDGLGIRRYRKTAGAWALEATFGPAIRQMACYRDGADVVCIGDNPSTLYRLRDTGASLPSGTCTAIITAATNTAFRGIALAPVP